MNVSAWSIRNPIPAILLFVLLTLAGILAFRAMKIQQFMDIDLPTVTVTATLPGAAPAQMETEVARKIENSVATVQGIKHIYTKVQDGTATVTVEFRLEKPVQEAVDDVRDAVSRIHSDLPGDLHDPVIGRISVAGAPILTYTVASQRMDDEALSWFVDNTVAKAMLAVRGVGAIARVGGVTREVRVELDPARLLALNATAADISRQLRRIQQDASGGRADVGGIEQSVRTIATVQSAEELAAMDIVLSDGRRVRLDQVATVSDTVGEPRSAALLDGRPVVGFEITRSRGAGEVEVAEVVRRALEKLNAEHPDITITEAFHFVHPVTENDEGEMVQPWAGAAREGIRALSKVLPRALLHGFRLGGISPEGATEPLGQEHDFHHHRRPRHLGLSGRRPLRGPGPSAGNFLSASGMLTAGSFLFDRSIIRTFMPSPLLASLANSDTDRVLVLVRLDGGNDSLNMIIERGNDLYYNARPTIAIPDNNLWAMSPEYGMPLTSSALQPMWNEGMMKAVFNVGYPQPNFSHFRSYDIIATGSASDEYLTTGWLGRFLDNQYPAYLEAPPTVPPALQIVVRSNLIFRSDVANMALAVSSPQEFYQIASSGQLYNTSGLGNTAHELELAFMRQTANSAFRYAGTVKDAYFKGANTTEYQANNDLAEQMSIVARLIKGNLGTKIYLVQLGDRKSVV